jgi:hypothetical protein
VLIWWIVCLWIDEPGAQNSTVAADAAETVPVPADETVKD